MALQGLNQTCDDPVTRHTTLFYFVAPDLSFLTAQFNLAINSYNIKLLLNQRLQWIVQPGPAGEFVTSLLTFWGTKISNL